MKNLLGVIHYGSIHNEKVGCNGSYTMYVHNTPPHVSSVAV